MMELGVIFRTSLLAACLLLGWIGLAGCGMKVAAVPPVKKTVPPKQAPSQPQRKAPPAAANVAPPAKAPPAEERPKEASPAIPPRTEGTLTDLVNQAAAAEFRLPEIDEAKVAVAGIRKIAASHLTIYTDLDKADEVEELPHVFDLALPQWIKYFELDEKTAADWKVVGYLMKDKERFAGAGLMPDNLPPFLHGFQRGSEFWWYDQPSAFYRRELMLHEGTHAFMMRFLGGMGPPWYAEGMAEFLGTHKWEGGELTVPYSPKTKDEAPYWGRVKVIKDEYAKSRGMLLTDIFRYDARAHLQTEPYGWCWGAATFLDNHPLTQKAFRKLRSQTGIRSVDFSDQFQKELAADWPAISEDWQLFVANADYGYDVERAAVVRKEKVVPLPAEGASVTLRADRGWQSTGLSVEAERTYTVSATGQYQVAKTPQPWTCEPGGITIHYHRGKPLGMLLAAIGDVKREGDSVTPLAHPTAVGTLAELTPTYSGTLYLSINEPAGGLADNEGTVSVRIELLRKSP